MSEIQGESELCPTSPIDPGQNRNGAILCRVLTGEKGVGWEVD